MRVENVDDSVIWSEVVYQTVDVIYSSSVFYKLYCVFMYKVTGKYIVTFNICFWVIRLYFRIFPYCLWWYIFFSMKPF